MKTLPRKLSRTHGRFSSSDTVILWVQHQGREQKDAEDASSASPRREARGRDSGAPGPPAPAPRRTAESGRRIGGWAAVTGRAAAARAGGTFPRGLRAHRRLPRHRPGASLQGSPLHNLRGEKSLTGRYLASLQTTPPARGIGVKPQAAPAPASATLPTLPNRWRAFILSLPPVPPSASARCSRWSGGHRKCGRSVTSCVSPDDRLKGIGRRGGALQDFRARAPGRSIF